MPGKKDPEYFPLNMNVNLYDFESSFHHGKYEHLEDGDEDTMSTDDEMTTVAEVLRSRSGSNTSRPRRMRNVSLNMTQNSDDEGEGSMQSSSDLDLDGEEEEEVDMMDTLVLSIRDKLRMDPKFNSTTLWTAESTPPSTPYDLSHHDTSSACQSSHSHLRRRRMHPYASGSQNSLKVRNPIGCIQKKGSSTTKHYWRRGKSNPDSPREHPYELLQELIDSGSLIKEAVRRLSNTKRLGCVVSGGSRSTSNPIPIASSPLITATNTLLSSPNARFTTRRDEDSNLPLSAQ